MSSFALPSSAPPSHLTSSKIKWFSLTRLQTSKFEFVVTTGVPCAIFPAKNFVLGPVPFKDRCNRSFFYYFVSLLFFYYLKTLYFTFTYKRKKKKKLQKNYIIARLFICTKKIIITLIHKKEPFGSVNCCSKLISDKISRISLKSCLLCLRSWLNFILLRLPLKERP